MQEHLVTKGFVCTVRSVEQSSACVVTLSGEELRIFFDFQIPSCASHGVHKRWVKNLRQAAGTSEKLKILGASFTSNRTWRITESSFCLRQCQILSGHDLRLFEAFTEKLPTQSSYPLIAASASSIEQSSVGVQQARCWQLCPLHDSHFSTIEPEGSDEHPRFDAGIASSVCAVRTVADGCIEHAMPIRIATGSTPAELIEAETKLNFWESVMVLGDHDDDDDDVPLNHVELSQGSPILLSCVSCKVPKVSSGITLRWPTGACMLELMPHESLSGVTYDQTEVDRFEWTDANGFPFPKFKLIAHHGEFMTKHDFQWPVHKTENQILLVRVVGKEISTQVVQHSSGETIQDLLHAEQIMVGPSVQVVGARNRLAEVEPLSTNLCSVPVVAVHFASPTGLVSIEIHDGDEISKHWVKRGTRLFEVFAFKPFHVAVDNEGFEMPWDMPIYQRVLITVSQRDDEMRSQTCSPTIPYEVETPHEIQQPDLQKDSGLTSIVRNATAEFQAKLLALVKVKQLNPERELAAQRLVMLCQHGAAMGDDEMTLHLKYVQTHSKAKVIGILSWHEEVNMWISSPLWVQDVLDDESQQAIAVIFHSNHWIPVHFNPGECCVTYWNGVALPANMTDRLCQVVAQGCEAQCRFVPTEDITGWCGFQALAVLFSIAACQDPINEQVDGPSLIEQLVEPTLLEKYQCRMSECPDPFLLNFASALRASFAQSQSRSPTSPSFHGKGHQDAQPSALLKNAGRIAGILIAKGHQSEEAMQVAQQLAEMNLAKCRNLGSVKENKAYSIILESCVEHQIEIKSLSTSQAVQRLQAFFRSKRPQRSQAKASEVDITKVTFLPKTFMIQNGEFVTPQQAWSPATKGLAIGNPKEVQHLADQAKLITEEANSVLTSMEITCKDPVKCNAMVVPVQDAVGNKALVRMYITHFGTKPVVRVPPKDGTISLPKFATLSLTVYREHADANFWQMFAGAPAKTLLAVLRDDPSAMPVSQIFSRRWTLDSKQVDPKIANMFSMLATVNDQEAHQWLKRSGFTQPPVYVSLKRSHEGDNSEAFRVIWTSKRLCEVVAATGSVKSQMGIVFKSPSSFGIRVPVGDFAESWKLVKGSAEVPTQLECNHKFIISALPPNITGTDLEAWGKEVGWQFRVLRKFSDSKYLVGSPNEPPTDQLSLNGHDVLLKEYVDFLRPKGQIVAGHLQVDIPNVGEQKDDLDPWAGKSIAPPAPPVSGGSGPWANYRSTTAPSRSSTVGGLSSEVADQHASRISTMESELQVLKEQIQNQHADNQHRFQQMDSKISNVSSQLRDSLQEALQEQSRSLIATFETLMRGSPKSNDKPNRSRSPKAKS
eukprot:s3376_g6.t1